MDNNLSLTVGEIIAAIKRQSGDALPLTLCGPEPQVRFTGIKPLNKAGATDIAFLADPRYLNEVKTTGAGLVVIREADKVALFGDTAPRAMLLCENPYAFFAYASQLMDAFLHPRRTFIHPKAIVDETAKVDPTARVDAGAIIEAGAQIGAHAHIGAGAVVGAGSVIGDETYLHANSTVNAGCRIGNRTIIHSGAVIGADGFGFAPHNGRWVKIAQLGGVRIGDDVEIGANTCVDRGAIEDTVIEDGVKLDNLIQIAHNVRVGAHTVMAGGVIVAGSTNIGSHVTVGGCATINGHISIPDGVTVGPATVIISYPKDSALQIGFYPAMERGAFERSAVLIRHLPEMRKSLKDVQKRLETLEKTKE
ncbi:MAG TPA: UDP-3-O-(3-hydroxymyristoyl)glucosamine N-acyltransferase [Sutterella sp.]|nr:UDP-3-O-(3-hydroxymyristoyl)glucosamine N-acyltransferase [Sutterella sp.]